MEDPFKYVQNQDQSPPQPVNVPVSEGDTPPPAPISTLQQQARYKRIALIVIVVVVLIAAIGGITLILTGGGGDEPPQQTATPNEQQPAGQPTHQEPTITQETETYNSPRFLLSFAHPVDWTVEEDSGEGLLTLTSPQVGLPGATGQTTGIVQMTIRKPSAELPEFKAGNAVAAIPSQKITYTNPSPAQRGDTYVSFLNFADSTSSGQVDGVYITGDFGYKQDQAIPKVDIEKIDPIISVRFYACDGQCTQPLGVGRDFTEHEAGRAVLDILKSLRIS